MAGTWIWSCKKCGCVYTPDTRCGCGAEYSRLEKVSDAELEAERARKSDEEVCSYLRKHGITWSNDD